MTMQPRITTLVMPVYEPYATAVGRRKDDLTCLIRGWRDPDAARMVTARTIVDREGLMPVLFRPLGREQDDHTVTHAAVCGLFAFRDEVAADRELRDALHRIRVEHDSLPPEHDWFAHGPDAESVSFYVVTAGVALPRPLPLQTLRLANQGRPLNPNLQQAFAHVELPESLFEWYAREWGHRAALIGRFVPLRTHVAADPGGAVVPKRGPGGAVGAGPKRTFAFPYTDASGHRKIAFLPV
jgi:hypothetical protein